MTRMWEYLFAPDRRITASSVSEFSCDGIRGIPRVVLGRLIAKYARIRSATDVNRRASSGASQALPAKSSASAASMRRSMPVSYAPTIIRHPTVCDDRADMPTTSVAAMPKGQRGSTPCSGRTDELLSLVGEKVRSQLGRKGGPCCWVPSELSILSPYAGTLVLGGIREHLLRIGVFVRPSPLASLRVPGCQARSTGTRLPALNGPNETILRTGRPASSGVTLRVRGRRPDLVSTERRERGSSVHHSHSNASESGS